jgi:hypothetical protein
MSHIEKNISPFIAQQFPGFYMESGKNLVAFVRAYYEWLESEGNTIGYARSLLDYNDIDRTEQQFIDQFRKTYLSSIPKDIVTDERLLVKHILDLYRSKGSKRAIELLFRILFNEDIDVYVPGEYLLRPSDGEWTRIRYIETTSHPKLAQLIGRTISSSDGTSLAVVENSFRKVVNGKTISVIYLSAVRGQFKYGDKIICDGLIDIDDAPIITGSLTAVAIENGGAKFNTGDILSIKGSGVDGKARVASVRDENGKVRFSIINGGSGFSINPNITVRTTLNLVIENLVGEFSVGSSVQSTTTGANGNIVFANTSYLTLVDFSTSPQFVPGLTITDGIATATIRETFGGGGSGASFQIGDLINKEILFLNQDIISDYLGTQIETQIQVNISSPTGNFTVGNRAVSSANTCTLQIQYRNTNTAIIGEKYSNTSLGIANLYVYNSDAGLIYVTGSESDLTSANLVVGSIFVGNTSGSIIELLNTPVKEITTGNGTIFLTNSSVIVANINFNSSYYVPTATVIDSGNTAVNATIVSQSSLTTWNFPEPLLDISNLDKRIDAVLNIYELEVGTISALKNINPGEGYSSPPYVDIIQSDVALLGEIADNGGIKGHNATISTQVSNEQGVVTAVDVYDSGFGYVPGESIFLTKDGREFSVSGIAVIDTDGKGAGYYVGKRGFLSDIMKIQDSKYYQIYSYEIVAKRMIDTYEKLVNDLVHPAGYKLFGRYRSLELMEGDVSTISNNSTSQSNTTVYSIVDTNFIANTATYTRASTGTFFNAVMQIQSANTNIPRFEFSNIGSYAGLLIEGQRTNAFVNPRQPWDAMTNRAAVSRTIGATAPDGTNNTDRIVETIALSDHYIESSFGGAIVIPANQINTYSVFLRPAGRTVIIIRLYDSATYLNAIGCTATLVGEGSVGSNANIGAGITLSSSIRAVGGGWYRVTCTGTVSNVANTVRPRIALVNASTTYTGDGVSGVDVWGLQAEAGSFASSLILPPAGVVAASTRTSDILTSPLSRFGITDSGACTVLWRGSFNATNFGDTQTIVGIDNGTDNNRYDMRLSTAGFPQIIRVTSGAVSSAVVAGASPIIAGNIVRAGMTVDSNGRLACVFNSESVQAVVGGPTSGLTTINYGISRGVVRPLWGRTQIFQVIPYAISDSELRSAVSNL